MRTNADSELSLIERAADDVDAFSELVERYREAICNQCHARVRDRHYAEDLAQETFVRAYLKLGQLEDPERFSHWLRKIASNVCKEFARTPHRREFAWEAVEELPHSELAEPATDLESLLGQLPDADRLCVELYYNDRLGYSEIASTLGISISSVRNRLHRAKTLLRKEMAPMPHDDMSLFTKRVLEKLDRLRSSDPDERARAASEMLKAFQADRIDWLLSILRQPDAMERSFAIRPAGRTRSPRVRDALVEIVLTDEWEENRIKAANALVGLGDPSVIPDLRGAMGSAGIDKDVAAALRSAIRQLEGRSPVESREDDELRLREDLGAAAGDRKARMELLRQLRSALKDPLPEVRTKALKALGELGDKRATPAVMPLLDDPSPGIRRSAAVVLGKLKSKTAVPALVRVLMESDDRAFLQPVILALGEIGDRSAVPGLLCALEERAGDWTANHLVYATRAIGSLATTDDLPRIRETIQRLRGTKDQVWESYLDQLWARALAKAADSRYLTEVVESLERNPADLGLIDALGRIGGPRAVDILKERLCMHGPKDAACTLMSLGEPGMQAVREALTSDDPYVRRAAVEALFFGGGDDAAMPVVREMAEHDPDSATRFYAKAVIYRQRKSDGRTG